MSEQAFQSVFSFAPISGIWTKANHFHQWIQTWIQFLAMKDCRKNRFRISEAASTNFKIPIVFISCTIQVKLYVKVTVWFFYLHYICSWPYFNIFQVELQLPVVHSLVFTPVAGLAGQVVVDQSWLDPSKTTGRVRLGLWTSTKKSSKKSVLEKDSLFRKFLVWWLKWADRFECGNMTSCSRQSQSSMVCI